MSQPRQLALTLAEVMEALIKTSGGNLSSAWAVVLQVENGSSNLFLGVTMFFSKFVELRAIISDSQLSDRAKGLYLGAIDHLIQFANPVNLAGITVSSVSQSKDKIDLLHLAADALPAGLIPDVHPATLEELCAELEQLLATSGEADIEPDVRRLIQTSLQTLLMALRSYKLFGPDGAARIYGSVVAELARTLQQSPPKSKTGKTALRKVIEVTKKIGAVVIWTSAVTGGIDKLLTDGADIAEFITGPDQAVHGESKEPRQ